MRNKGVAIRLWGLIKELLLHPEHPHEVIIRPVKSKRSLEQNARLHKIIGMAATEAGYTIQEMKDKFKEELLEPWAYEAKTNKPIYKSTADMSVKELNLFMEAVERLAAIWFNVSLPYDEGGR